jgi:hypothetical protein
MASVASFYFAMFKRFQAICGTGSGHVNPDSAPASTLYGGFSLYSTQDPQGIFGQLGTQATTWNLAQGMRPLNPLSNDPLQNPLWVMLNASLGAAPQPTTVVVNGQTWPTMPPPPEDEFTIWLAANATTPRLIDAFGDWIKAGKVDDSPQDAPLSFVALKQATLAPWPLKNQEYTSVLFVASMPGDDGRRHGDLSMPDPPANHVPPNFWATSQIFLTWPPGVPGQTAGKIANPASLKPKEEYWVVALVGNAGGDGTGVTANVNSPKCTLLGDAQCFNTFTSPGTSLPSLDNIDPASTSPTYEALYMAGGSYDVAGFRFNVDAVFSQLATALGNQVPPAMLGGLQPADWLRDGHPCVKVRVMAGEQLDHFPPAGNAPQPPTLESNPLVDRHIAQRNLAPFDVTEMGLKKIKWTNFIVAQAGKGWNELVLQQALPPDALHFYFAIPRAAYERWIDPRTSKGGVVRGLEVVTDAPSRPFPEAVILRQTGAVLIRIADHGHEKERFFGMSIGIEGDPAGFKRARDSTVSVVHAAQEGGVVGGFTLQVPTVR